MERPVAAAPVVVQTPEKRAAVALNTAEYEIKLQELLTNSAGILTVQNKAGRDECHTAYMVLKNTRCKITNVAEEASEDAKAFTKAVKVESTRLIAIITTEEDRLEGLRDGWDESEKARKAALIEAEKDRVAKIADAIAAIRECETDLIRMTKTAADAQREIAALTAFDITETVFQERFAEACELKQATLGLMLRVQDERYASETAALAAEEARIAEAARIEAERVELAKQRAENEKIANEQAAERQRLANLAAAQEAEATRLREKAAENLAAELAGIAEQVRRTNAAQAEADAKMQAAQAAFEAQKAEFAAAVKMEADHAEALIDDATFDDATFDDAMTRLAAVDTPTFSAPSGDLARCTATAQAMLTNGRSLVQADAETVQFSIRTYIEGGGDAEIDEAPTDKEIAEFGKACGLTPDAWVDRLAAFCERMTSVSPTGQRYSRTTFKDNGEPIFLNADGSRSIFCDLND